MQCVHGPIFVLRLCVVRVWASSLCSGCGRKCTLSVLRLCAVRVWVPALCSGCGQKVHPHCAQTVCRACMGTRSVLRLWAKSAPALCSDCFFFSFFFSYRPHATPPCRRETKKKARPNSFTSSHLSRVLNEMRNVCCLHRCMHSDLLKNVQRRVVPRLDPLGVARISKQMRISAF